MTKINSQRLELLNAFIIRELIKGTYPDKHFQVYGESLM